MIKEIHLKPGKEAALKMRHPWVFSGALKGGSESAGDGELVRVMDSGGKIRGVGHFQQSSIAVRMLSFTDEVIDRAFYTVKLREAWNYRQQAGFSYGPANNCFRWINAEGDGLPGLVVDRYGSLVVVQFHSVGMYLQYAEIVEAIKEVFPGEIDAVYLMPVQQIGDKLKSVEEGFAMGNQKEFEVCENGMKYFINPDKGQKTGFFLDQRDNRAWVKQWSKGKKVLNGFCYTGGFSVAAIQGGAEKVDSVDASAYATEQCARHIELNGGKSIPGNVITEDVMKYLQTTPEKYDLMILDPPAFAKSRKKSHNAVQAYKRLNALGLKKIEDGGMLVTFSCSQVIDEKLFEDTIRAAGMEVDREVRILKKLGPGIDHPVNLFHREGHYLKGLALYVGARY
nr:class I SAM-dependent rRNA methyltransferase [Saprospiraceae bacterium]